MSPLLRAKFHLSKTMVNLGMLFLDRLKFASSHEWVKHEGAVATTAEVSSLINLLIHSLFPLLTILIGFNYRACTIPYRFPSDNPRKPTLTELSWIDLLYNSTPSFK
ncbi:hypothetical protein FF1_019537 [Malus domestica]